MSNFFLDNDINEITEASSDLISSVEGKHIVIIGGRGFLGRYLTEIFDRFNKIISKPIKLTVIDNLVVSGELGSYWPKYENFFFLKSDASESIKIKEDVDYIIHAAGIASPFYYRKKPLETLDVAINGTIGNLTVGEYEIVIYDLLIIFTNGFS